MKLKNTILLLVLTLPRIDGALIDFCKDSPRSSALSSGDECGSYICDEDSLLGQCCKVRRDSWKITTESWPEFNYSIPKGTTYPGSVRQVHVVHRRVGPLKWSSFDYTTCTPGVRLTFTTPPAEENPESLREVVVRFIYQGATKIWHQATIDLSLCTVTPDTTVSVLLGGLDIPFGNDLNKDWRAEVRTIPFPAGSKAAVVYFHSTYANEPCGACTPPEKTEDINIGRTYQLGNGITYWNIADLNCLGDALVELVLRWNGTTVSTEELVVWPNVSHHRVEVNITNLKLLGDYTFSLQISQKRSAGRGAKHLVSCRGPCWNATGKYCITERLCGSVDLLTHTNSLPTTRNDFVPTKEPQVGVYVGAAVASMFVLVIVTLAALFIYKKRTTFLQQQGSSSLIESRASCASQQSGHSCSVPAISVISQAQLAGGCCPDSGIGHEHPPSMSSSAYLQGTNSQSGSFAEAPSLPLGDENPPDDDGRQTPQRTGPHSVPITIEEFNRASEDGALDSPVPPLCLPGGWAGPEPEPSEASEDDINQMVNPGSRRGQPFV